MKSQTGITLIAVIITVIVMLILAGVSITMTVGEDGILENSQKAAEDTENSASKDYILESWAYVLAKCEDIPVIESAIENGGLTKEEIAIFTKASNIFGKYISNYGQGVLENKIYNIKTSDEVASQIAYKVTFKLNSSKESKTFYIVNDTNVYEENDFKIKFKAAKEIAISQ